MKTNQVLIRKMGNIEISQRTSDEMFNATELVKNWNEYVSTIDKNDNTQKNGYLKKKKDLDDFFSNKQTKEFINVLSQKEDNVFTKTRGKNGGTWMHPYLFIDFAMWLNPEFKYEVLKFVHDELIKNRHEAGDGYRELSSQVARIVNKQFMPVAMQTISKGLNHIVYGRHERNIRNKEATESYLKTLTDLENKIAMLIDEGFLRSYEDVLKYLRLIWQKENQPKIFDN
jgi:hypothetical protein